MDIVYVIVGLGVLYGGFTHWKNHRQLRLQRGELLQQNASLTTQVASLTQELKQALSADGEDTHRRPPKPQPEDEITNPSYDVTVTAADEDPNGSGPSTRPSERNAAQQHADPGGKPEIRDSQLPPPMPQLPPMPRTPQMLLRSDVG